MRVIANKHGLRITLILEGREDINDFLKLGDEFYVTDSVIEAVEKVRKIKDDWGE